MWAIAEGDVEGDSFSPKFSQTVFLLKENTREEVLQAMKEGRIYALFGPLSDNLSLTGFDVDELKDLIDYQPPEGEEKSEKPKSIIVCPKCGEKFSLGAQAE